MNNISDFERQVIFRIDYVGPLDTVLNETVKRLKPDIFTYGMEETNSLPPNPKTGTAASAGRVAINEADLKMPVYKFSGNGKNLEISRQFLTFTIVVGKEQGVFADHICLLAEIMNSIKDGCQIFRMLRIGLRKIYICYLPQTGDIKEYFRPEVFDLDDAAALLPGSKCRASNTVAILDSDGYRINYVRNLQDKNEPEIPACQAAIDIDAHKENTEDLLVFPKNKTEADKVLRELDRIGTELFLASLVKDYASSITGNAVFLSDI